MVCLHVCRVPMAFMAKKPRELDYVVYTFILCEPSRGFSHVVPFSPTCSRLDATHANYASAYIPSCRRLGRCLSTDVSLTLLDSLIENVGYVPYPEINFAVGKRSIDAGLQHI